MTSFKYNIGHFLVKCLRIAELSVHDKKPAVIKHVPKKCPMFYLKDVIIGVFLMGGKFVSHGKSEKQSILCYRAILDLSHYAV